MNLMTRECRITWNTLNTSTVYLASMSKAVFFCSTANIVNYNSRRISRPHLQDFQLIRKPNNLTMQALQGTHPLTSNTKKDNNSRQKGTRHGHSHQKERRYAENLIQMHVTSLTVNCNIVVLYAITRLIMLFLIQKTRPWDRWLLIPIYWAKSFSFSLGILFTR